MQLAVTFDTDDAEHPTLTGYLFFSDAAMEVTERALRALGWDPLEQNWAIDDLIASDDIMGAKVSLTCAFEEYEGKRRFKVKFINELGGGSLKERLSDDEARAFTAGLRQKLGVTGGSKRKPTGVKQEEEVPF